MVRGGIRYGRDVIGYTAFVGGVQNLDRGSPKEYANAINVALQRISSPTIMFLINSTRALPWTSFLMALFAVIPLSAHLIPPFWLHTSYSPLPNNPSPSSTPHDLLVSFLRQQVFQAGLTCRLSPDYVKRITTDDA